MLTIIPINTQALETNMKNDVLICGDFMPGGVLYRQDSYVDNKVVEFIKQHQYSIATLECALASDDSYLLNTPEIAIPKVVCRKKDLERLYAMGINVVSLANNHVFDLGIESYDRLTEELTANNIKFFGAGHNVEEASRPVVLCMGDKRIAIYGCCLDGVPPTRLVVATKDKPGIWKASISELSEVIKLSRSQYDYVFVMPHGGQEHKSLPMWDCVEMSRKMVDNGADGVFWSHAHCLQPYFMYKKRPIYFGLGSLLFPDVYVFPPRSVFYPDDQFDFSLLDRCDDFPKKVDMPTLAIWSKSSRKGLGISLSFNKKILIVPKLFELAQNNILSESKRLKSNKTFFLLWLTSLLIILPKSVYGVIRNVVYKQLNKH